MSFVRFLTLPPVRPPFHYDIENSMEKIVDRMFAKNDFFDEIVQRKASFSYKEGVTTYRYEVPGFAKDDLKVSLERNILSVEGVKDERKISFIDYLSSNVDKNSVNAECKDGLLVVKFKDKEPPPSTKKEIEIK